MADGLSGTPRTPWMWTELFRTFQVALDPKKLLLAAGGLVAMAWGWWLLSVVIYPMRSEPLQINYSAEAYQKSNDQLSIEDARKKATDAYARDLKQYMYFYSLAGPANPDAAETWKHHAGIFRMMPWNENRGPNPFMMITGRYRAEGMHDRLYEPGHLMEWLATKQAPVLIEPLIKFLRPVVKLLSPNADVGTRIYLLLGTLVTLAVWGFFGGVITRIAVLQLAGKDGAGLMESIRFVCGRYAHYVAAPLVPLLFVAGITFITILFGLVHLFPYLGDVFDSILWPIPMLLGFAQALLLVGLVGYPLMYPTISAEGSDTFDALSRSYNYVYQAPWQYLWNSIVAIAYGMVVVFFVCFMGSMVVYLTKWAMSQTPGTEVFSSRRVDHLFIYAPDSFDWRDLLVDRPELKSTALPADRATYLHDHLYPGNYLSAAFVGLWVTLVLLFVVGYAYSYFFTASTMIYLLMRHHVDDTEIDEIYADDEVPDEPLMPPSAPPAPPGPQMQMVDAPTLRTPSGDGEKPAGTPVV